MANSPFDNVANEILGTIFSFCPSSAQDFFDSSYKTSSKNGAVALRVSHVSRRWRAVSHTTPSLWRTITVIEPWVGKYSIDDELLAPHIEEVEHYLELSGTLPLRIVLVDLPSFSFEGTVDKFQFRAIEGLIYPLTAKIHRWESFHARLAPEYFIDVFDLNEPVPSLTELELATYSPPGPRFSEDEPVPCLTADLFSKETPKLERLEVYGIELEDPEDMPCFAPNSALRHRKPFDVSLCPLLPRLTHLVLVFRLSSITKHTTKMIKSRISAASEKTARLQSVCLYYHGDNLLQAKPRSKLEKLGKTEALKLDVKTI